MCANNEGFVHVLISNICNRSKACLHFCGSIAFVKISAMCSNVGQRSSTTSGLEISSWIAPGFTLCVRGKLLSLGEKPFFAILMVASLSSLSLSLSAHPEMVCHRFNIGIPSSNKLLLRLTISDSAVDLLVDVCFLEDQLRGKKVFSAFKTRSPPETLCPLGYLRSLRLHTNAILPCLRDH